MKILVLHPKQPKNLAAPKPKDILAIPFINIERIESSEGSENMPCYVNGHYVEESFNFVMSLLETT